MSLPYLLEAVRNQLRDRLSGSGPDQFERTAITVEPDEQPSRIIGDKHIVVYCSNWGPSNNADTTKDEEFQISCSLTMRASAQPRDRFGDNIYLDQLKGIAKIANDIAFALDRNYNTINAASDAAPNTQFFEPLIWQGTDPNPRVVDGSWFLSEPNKFSGLVMESRFRGARAITNSLLNNT